MMTFPSAVSALKKKISRLDARGKRVQGVVGA